MEIIVSLMIIDITLETKGEDVTNRSLEYFLSD